MEPARKLPGEDEPQIRPHLGVIQGGGEGDGTPAGNLHAVPGVSGGSASSDSNAVDAPHLQALEGGGEGDGTPAGNLRAVGDNNKSGGLYHPDKDTGATSPDKLGAAETAGAGAAAAGGVIGGGMITEAMTPWGKFKGFMGRNKGKSIAGGSILGVIVGGGVFTMVISTGPFQFIHAAQLLQRSHFGTQENAGDNRMAKLWRYAQTGNKGETRVSALESKYANNMRDTLEAKGIKVIEGGGNVFHGLEIDTTSEDSPFRGMNEDEIKAKLSSMGLSDTSIVHPIEGTHDTSFSIDPDGLFGRRNAVATMGSLLDKGKLGTILSIRSFNKYGLVNFHPFQRTVQGIKDKIGARFRNAEEQFAADGEPIDQGMAETPPTTPTTTEAPPVESSEVETVAKDAKSGGEGAIGKIASGANKILNPASQVEMLTCAANQIYDDLPKLRYIGDILPMTRMAGLAFTMGNQMMSGQDLNMSEVAAAAASFNKSSGPTAGRSWMNAQTFLADTGSSAKEVSNGQDIDPNMKSLLSGDGHPSYLAWANQPGLCSPVSQFIQAGLGLGLMAIPGIGEGAGFVSAALNIGKDATVGIAKGVIESEGLQIVVKALEEKMIGGAVDTSASGAQWGNYVNYGARYLANDEAVAVGGTQLSTPDANTVNTLASAASDQQFETESLAYKLFNPYDQRTLISHVIDSQSPNVSQNVASIFGTVSNIGSLISSTLHDFGSLLSAKVFAVSPAEANTYTYPFPQFGFSESDLDNNTVANPYTNANDVATLLDNTDCSSHPCGQDFVTQAKTCFNVNITRDENGKWDVQLANVSTSEFESEQYDLYNSSGYNAQNCIAPTTPVAIPQSEWLQVRMFIFDTTNMNSYACTLGDPTSCSDIGYNDGGTDSAAPASTGEVSGNSATLAKEILANSNITLQKSCTTGATQTPAGCAYQDILAASQGQKVTPGKIAGQNNGSASTSACSARTPVYLDATLLQAMLNLANKYQYTVQDIDSGHDCDSGLHPQGKAFDVYTVNGSPVEGNCDSTTVQSFRQYAATVMAQLVPGQSGNNMPGVSECSNSDQSLSAGVRTFFDSSDQVHIDVGYSSSV